GSRDGGAPAGTDRAGDSGGGGSLPMGPADRNTALEPHQLGQHLGAAHDRQPFGARRDELGIVALDRGRYHDHLRIAECSGGMADGNFRTLIAQALDVGAIRGVGTLHGVAEIDDPLRDPAHPDAANADEMDRPDVARQFHGIFPLHPLARRAAKHSKRIYASAATRMTKSASRSAASTAPCERAAAAIATS